MTPNVTIREARDVDVEAVRAIYMAVYGEDYPYQTFYDLWWLRRSVYTDDILILVAEDPDSNRILGTASVVFDVGAHSDLLAEFGRLAVAPEARGQGIGHVLMRARCDHVSQRIHVGVVQNRCVHPKSQRISRAHGFVPVGFLPLKYAFHHRESVSLWCHHFSHGLKLRRNHPHIVPEAHALASLALQNCGLPPDAIVDHEAPAYPHGGRWPIEELTSQGLPALLRIERGRLRQREVFGPMRLQYGFFHLASKQASYLIARQPGTRAVAGAIGFIRDDVSHNVNIFELISRDERVVRHLLTALIDRCLHTFHTQYIEIDVSAYSPRLQRTLIELDFIPAAYVPAMVFHDVERLDVIKMVKLFCPIDFGELDLLPESQAVADLVQEQLTRQLVAPRLANALGAVRLFRGLTAEQANCIAHKCTLRHARFGELLFNAGAPPTELFLSVDGQAIVVLHGEEVARAGPGELLGEVAALTEDPHSASALVSRDGTWAVLSREALKEIERRRPDVAMVLYRNLASGLGRKLRQTDLRLTTKAEGG